MEDDITMDGPDMQDAAPPALDDVTGDDTPDWDPELQNPVGAPIDADLGANVAIDDEPPAGGFGEQGDAPPAPEGAVDGDDAGDIMGAGQPGAEPAPAPMIDLGQGDDAPMPPVGGDTETAPPGAPTGIQGEAPPLPEGAGGDGNVVGDGQPTAPVIDLGQGDDAPMPPVGGDTETAPPGAPTGIQGEAPPLPDGAGGDGDLGDIIGRGQGAEATTTDATATDGAPAPGGIGDADTTTPPPGAPTGEQGDPPPAPFATQGEPGDVMGAGQPGATTANGGPATLSSTAASQLLSGLLPGMLPEDVEVAIMGAADDGTVDVNEVINLLHVHGLETSEQPVSTVAGAMAAADKVQLVGNVDGKLVPLTVEHLDVEGGLMVCIDPDGGEYECRIEDVDREWQSSGAPLITAGSSAAPAAPPMGAPLAPTGHVPSGSPAPPPIAPDPNAALPTPPPIDGLPAVAVGDDSSGGSGLGTALGVGAVAFIPVAIGGGILARKLARRA